MHKEIYIQDFKIKIIWIRTWNCISANLVFDLLKEHPGHAKSLGGYGTISFML